MSGKLIVIEGLDGSGKLTQSKLLCESLGGDGYRVKYLTFPDYDDPSSTLVKMYLAGEFGQDPNDVNPYAASLFYTVDRYASFKKGWSQDYYGGAVLVANRYTTSNAVHQTCKLPRAEWDAYLDWLSDTEFEKAGIPRPDAVIYLDMPPGISRRLISGRYGGDESKRDIHEKNSAYLEKSRESALYAAERLGWRIIDCADGGAPRSIEDIHGDVLSAAREVLCGCGL